MIYEHKRGATFDLSGVITPVGNTPTPDFTGWSGSAQIRSLNDNSIATLTFSWLDRVTGAVRITCDESLTIAWPLGVAELDVRLNSSNNDVVITSTQQIMVVKEITRA